MRSLALRGVVVHFGELCALHEVNLDLAPGQRTLLAGPNGSGKSTLMGVLLGLVRPDAGELRLGDRAATVDKAFKATVGYLPEAVAFAGNLSALQVLRFFARARGVDKGRVGEVLQRVDLVEASGRAVRGYSRGMLQRLGLAVAILSQPELLVLDEPTGGLDQQGLLVLWQILDEWKAAGRTVLMASHDLALMERRVDAVTVLSHGQVCAEGSPEELRRKAGVPVSVRFEMESAGTARSFCQELEAVVGPSVGQDEQVVTVSAQPEQLLELMALKPSEAQGLRGLRVEEPGFDAIYQALLEAPCTA